MNDLVNPATTSTLSSQATLERFNATILPHLDAAYNFARFLSRDADAAQDIVQDAFLRAHRSFGQFRGGDARSWVFAIVRNCYRGWARSGRSRAYKETPMGDAPDGGDEATRSAVYDLASEEDSPEMGLIRRSESQRVRDVIGALPEPMREVLVLREFEDFSYRQIAELIEVPIGTVMSRLARARQEFSLAWTALCKEEGIAK